jgi:hypothetical protein
MMPQARSPGNRKKRANAVGIEDADIAPSGTRNKDVYELHLNAGLQKSNI